MHEGGGARQCRGAGDFVLIHVTPNSFDPRWERKIMHAASIRNLDKPQDTLPIRSDARALTKAQRLSVVDKFHELHINSQVPGNISHVSLKALRSVTSRDDGE